MLASLAAAAALTSLAPVVVHDSRERSLLTSVAAASVPAPGRGSDRSPAVYGRVTPATGDGTWLQYWLFYARQDQDRGIVRTGRHAGDWEMVQLRLDPRGRPTQAVYAQHSGAERCSWSEVQRRDGHPVVYSARGSHASYLRPGVRDRMFPDPNDEADGRGPASHPRLVRVTATSPRWMTYRGPWGGAHARWWVPGEQDSPPGPAFQQQGRWSDPDAWARAASSCHADCDEVDECDASEKALGGGMAAAGTGVLGLLVLRRRRRRAVKDQHRS